MKYTLPRYFYSFLIFCLCGLSSASRAQIPIRQAPANPPLVVVRNLQEVWRLDNEEDESLPLMGIINQGVAAADGHIFLLDRQLAQILEIDPMGQCLGVLGRSGQGPGELEQPASLVISPDGRLGLVQVFPGKAVFLNRDNTPAGAIVSRNVMPLFFFLESLGEGWVLRGQQKSFPSDGKVKTRDHLTLFDSNGDSIRCLLEKTTTSDLASRDLKEEGQYFPFDGWDVTVQGQIWVALERDEYRLEVLRSDGSTEFIIQRAFSAHVRNVEERQNALKGLHKWGAGADQNYHKTILDTDQTIHSVLSLDNGTVWVGNCYSSRNLPEGIAARYDVFDGRGEFLKEVQLAFPFHKDRDYFQVLKNGQVLWYINGKRALDALYSDVEDRDGNRDEDEDEVWGIQVVLLE